MEKFNFNDSFFTHVIHFSGEPCLPSNFLLPRNNFRLTQLSTDLFNSINRLTVVSNFREKCQRWKLSKYFCFFPKLYLKMSSSTTMHIAKLVLFYEKPSWRGFLIQPKMYSTFWSDNISELDTPFPIKDFASICQDLNFFDILPLFCKCGHLEWFLKKLKIEIMFGWNLTL